MDLENIFGNREENRRRLSKRMHENNAFDDIVQNLEQTPFVGMRVKYLEDNSLGTIIAIAFRESPFRVEWDNESADKIDWFRGNQIGVA